MWHVADDLMGTNQATTVLTSPPDIITEPSMTETSEPPPTPKDAPSPFNSPRADVILQSSDNVHFRVRKAILSEASPVFESMFSLPPEQATSSSSSNSLLVVPLTEPSGVIEGLLRLCYPADTTRTDPRTIDEAAAWFIVARKYDMERVERYIAQAMRPLVSSAPLHTYCLSIRYRLGEDIARAAARSFLDEPLRTHYPSVDPELKHISAFAYINLCNYHNRCSTAAQDAIDRYLLADPNLEERCWKTCLAYRNKPRCSYSSRFSVDGAEYSVIKWFAELILHCKSLVKDRPSGIQLACHDTIKQALSSAGECSHCKEHAWDDVQAFLSLVKTQIDNAIAEVSYFAYSESFYLRCAGPTGDNGISQDILHVSFMILIWHMLLFIHKVCRRDEDTIALNPMSTISLALAASSSKDPSDLIR